MRLPRCELSGLRREPQALARAWARTAQRWWRINIEWLAAAARDKGPEYAARQFLQEFFYDENRPWLGRVIADLAEKPKPELLHPPMLRVYGWTGRLAPGLVLWLLRLTGAKRR